MGEAVRYRFAIGIDALCNTIIYFLLPSLTRICIHVCIKHLLHVFHTYCVGVDLMWWCFDVRTRILVLGRWGILEGVVL